MDKLEANRDRIIKLVDNWVEMTQCTYCGWRRRIDWLSWDKGYIMSKIVCRVCERSSTVEIDLTNVFENDKKPTAHC